jgi:class 3 adenylate cyclase
VECGRYLAEHIAGARYVELEGAIHGSWSGDSLLPPEMIEFLSGDAEIPEPAVDRVLATLLFTDIVASTERTAALGDLRWGELLDDHDRIAQSEVERFGGRIVKTTGDGLLATFDGPARGIQCAHAIRKRVAPLSINIRAGLHAGEIERRGDDISGLGVVIARRICDSADTGEVLTSRTVKELVTGSGMAFADRGEHSLKGVPDEWRLYAVST